MRSFMPTHPIGTLSRRRLLGTGLATAAAAGLLAACNSGPTPATPAGPATEGPWRWTDGVGQQVELPSRPTRIAAYGDAAVALINFGIRPTQIFHFVDPAQDPSFEGVDIGGIEIVGTTYGQLNIEAMAAAGIELVITLAYAQNDPDNLYYFNDTAQLNQVRQLAPVIAIKQTGSAPEVITATEELAVALGADPGSVLITSARADFDAAGRELTEAAKSGLSVTTLYAEDSGLYFAKAPDEPSLAYYADLGVNFVEIGGDQYYWHQVSWENADTYPSDVVLYSMRDSYPPEKLMQQPAFARLPAAAAGQLHPWKLVAMDYASQARYMRELAGWLSSDRSVT